MKSTKFTTLKITIYFLALFWLIITIYPILFLIQNSFKGQTEFFMGEVWNLPKTISFSNYIYVLKGIFFRSLFNSFFTVGVSLLILLFTGSMAAFGLSRIKFKSRNFFYLLFIGGLTIPIHIALIPVYITTIRVGLYDTLPALFGPFVAFNLPICIFILVSFMSEIPNSLEEAAYIDGATRWQVFWHVVVPLSRPAITAVGIINSVHLWNEFIFPLVLLSSVKNRPLTLALWNFQGEFSANVPAMMASLILTCLPLFIAYAIAHEKLIEGMIAGSIKG